jgi:hypothetical protein
VGEVNEVILGAAWVGDDVDSHYIPVNQEWADD